MFYLFGKVWLFRELVICYCNSWRNES